MKTEAAAIKNLTPCVHNTRRRARARNSVPPFVNTEEAKNMS